MVRVLHVLATLDSGGVEMLLYNYYNNMDQSKVNFDFIVQSDHVGMLENKFISMGSKVYHCTPKKKNLIKNIRQTNEYIKNNPKYDIVHCHQDYVSAIPVILSNINGINSTITHSHLYHLSDNLTRRVLKNIGRLIINKYAMEKFACGEMAGKWLYGEKAYNDKEFRVMPNAVDAKRFSYNSAIRDKMRSELNIQDKFVIGNVGRFTFQKNHEFIIDIFNEVYKENKNAVLMLIGNGELENQIKEKVDKLGLTEVVIFLCQRRDIPELMQAMDIFLLPSNFEGLPIVLVEAQAAGLKCFGSDALTREVLITDSIEYLSLKQTAKEWASEILKYQNGYRRIDTYNQIANAGFEIKSCAKWLEKFYMEMVQN